MTPTAAHSGTAPATHRHAVACKVDAQRWLGRLWRHLLGGQVHGPRAIGEAIQAQVLHVGVTCGEELFHTARKGQGRRKQITG